MTVRRFDTLPAPKAESLPNGWLRAPAIISRTGIFTYRNADGSVTRELRPPEEVFHADSIASFNLVPLTDSHPDGLVDAKNFKSLAIGMVADTRQDEDKLVCNVVVADEGGVAKVHGGKVQLSCGYLCDLEKADAGLPYDFIQRNIRGNHVALVHVGRAGPEARLKLDSSDAVLTDSTNPPESDLAACAPEVLQEMTTKKVKFDGAELEVPEALAPAFEKTQARADAAEKEAARLSEELKAANSPERIAGLVKARVELESAAKAVAADVKCDGLSDLEVKKAVIAKLDSDLAVEGKSADAIDAYFDAVVRFANKRNAATEAAAAALVAPVTTTQAEEPSAIDAFYKQF